MLAVSNVVTEVMAEGDNPNRFVISNCFEGIQTDFIVHLMNNSLHFYSLETGRTVMRSIRLIGKNEVPHPITSLAIGGTDRCVIAATGILHDKIFVFDLRDINTDEIDARMDALPVPFRFETAPKEFMVTVP